MTQVAIFARVSKGGQDYTRQVKDLTDYCTSQNYTIVATLAEKVSGAKSNKERKAIQDLLTLASTRQVSKVIVCEVSRLGRKTSEVLQVLEELTELGISVYVLNFNMETLTPDGRRNPIAHLMFTLLAEFARMEREVIIERIHSGLEEARRKGKVLGRKKGSVKPVDQFLKEKKRVVYYLNSDKDYSIREISKICGVSSNTVQKVKAILSQKN
ncbi:recombinase family protein [Pontibacter sp. H249]|uniref:recombinase family protein n=1 Tax=Pontibacter sp. H249 TaxID=3133420 RepID=UPI0030C4C6F5